MKRLFNKNKTNNSGFTMVEIIAAIVIIGIILVIILLGYSKYIKNSRIKYDNEQTNLFIQAGKDYFNDNRGYLPTAKGQKSCVTLTTLINNKYIDKIYDSNKKEYSGNSKVCATKVSTASAKYKYTGKLLHEGENDNSGSSTYNKPSITFKIGNENFGEGVVQTGETDKKYLITMSINDSNNEISSYKYTVHKKIGDTDNIYFVKGPIDLEGQNNKLDIDINLNTTGTYYIQAEAYNDKNQVVVSKSGQITLKFTKLNCNNAVTISGGTNDWTNENITNTLLANEFVDHYFISIKNASNNSIIEGPIRVNNSSDSNGIYSHTISANPDEVKKVYYEIIPYDKSNKDNDCVIKSKTFKIDKNPPRCLINSNIKGWTNQDVIINAYCYDSDSKCTKNEESKKIDTNFNTNYNVTFSDNAGNTVDCEPQHVQVDKTNPTPTLNAVTTYKSANQTLTLKCDDNYGITEYYFGTNPPSSSTVYTPITTTKNFTKDVTITSTGTYYLSCKDVATNTKNSSKSYVNYTINNMYQNLSGSAYTTNNYTNSSSNTYLIAAGTTLPLTEIYTIPSGSNPDRFVGIIEGNASSNSSSPSKPTITINENKTYTTWFTRNTMNAKYKTNGGTLQATTHTEDGSTTYNWGINSDGYITRNNNVATSSYRYGSETMDVANYNNREAMYIYRNGYTTTSGQEWICESGCPTANQIIPHAGNTNILCDASNNDCTVVLKVNWKRRNYTIEYNLNDGNNYSTNPSSYTIDSNTITLGSPSRQDYVFDGWTEQIKNLVWSKGFVNKDTGIVETNSEYKNSYYTDMIRLKAGIKYTLSGYGSYSGSEIRWRVYNLDGSYKKNVSATEYTPDSDCYVRILFYNAPTSAQRTGTVITSNTENPGTIPKGSTHNRVYTGNWAKDISKLNIILSETNYKYDGNAKTPTVTVRDGDKVLEEGENKDYKIEFKDNVNPGTATVTITGTGKYNSTTNARYTGTRDMAFTIEKADSKCPTTITAYSGTYDGSSHSITVSGTSNLGGTLKYSTDGGSTWKTTNPTRTNVGTTTVNIKVVGDSNHSDKDCGSKTIKVNAKSIAVTWDTTQTSFEYNGTGQAPAVTTPVNGVGSEKIALKRTTKIDAGTDYTSTASCDSVTGGQKKCGNYTFTNTTSHKFSITPKPVTVPTASNKTYNGSSQSGVTCPAESTASGDTSKIDVGTYTVTCTLSSTTNYKWNDGTTDPKAITWKINKKSIAVTWDTTQTSFKYTGSGLAPAVTTPVDGVGSEKIAIKRTTETDVGTNYTSTASCDSVTGGQAKCANYKLTNATSHEFTIEKGDAKCPTITAYSGTYDGTSHKLTISGTSNLGGTINYSKDGGTTWLTSNPGRTSVGTTTVNIKVVGDSNHNDKDCGSKTVTISKKSIAVTWDTTQTSFEYTGSGQAPAVTTPVDGVTVNGTTEKIAIKRTTQTEVGKGYTSTASCESVTNGQKSCSNYTLTNTTSHKFDIIEYIATCPTTMTAYSGTYDGTAHSITVSGTSNLGGTLKYSIDGGTTWVTSNPTITDVGTTTVKLKVFGDSNHGDKDCGSKTLKVTAKSIAVTWNTSQTSFEYTGSGQAPSVTTPLNGVGSEKIAIKRTTKIDVGTKYTSTASCDSVTGGQAKCTNYTFTNTTSHEFDITKKPTSCPTTITAYSGTYDGTSHKLTISGTSNLGGTINYSKDGGTTWATTNPTRTNVGTTTVNIKVVGDSNHSDKDCGSKTIKVNAKSIAVTWDTTQTSFKYTGSGLAPAVTTPVDGIGSEKIAIKRTTQAEVGKGYTSTASCSSVTGGQAKCANYKLTNATSHEFTIEKGDAKCPTITAYSGTYDGSSHKLTISGTSNLGGTINYSKNGGTTWLTSNPGRTNVGTTTVNIKVVGDSNHNDKDCGSKTITISKKNVAVTWDTTQTSFEYTGSGQAPAVTTPVDGVTVNGTTEKIAIKRTTQTEVGKGYTSTASCESVTNGQKSCSNYTLTNATSHKFDITKIPATCPTTITAYTGTYDGTAHSITVSGTSNLGGTINYSTDGGTTWQTSNPTSIDAGTTTVNVKVVGDSNHSDKDCGSKTLKVTAKSIAVTWDTSQTSFSYDGNGHAPGFISPVNGVTVNGTTEKISLVRPTKTDVGTKYTVTASCGSVSGGQKKCSNYTLTNATSHQFVITAVPATCPTLTSSTSVNDGTSKTITVSGSNLGGTINYSTDDGSTWSTTKPSTTTLGTTTVSVKVEGDSNHTTVNNCYVSGTTKPTINIYNARIDFNLEGGSKTDGNNPIYVKKNATNIYTGRTSTTTGAIPTVERAGYTFNGWYTAASGGTKIINADGTVIASKSGWTDANKKWLLSSHSNTQNTNPLYAQWTANKYTITLNKNGATNTPTASVEATYDSSTLDPTSITVPEKKYTISGFTTNADDTYDDTRHSNGTEVSSTTQLKSTATFNGWYTSSSSGSKVLSNASSPVLQSSVSGYTDANGNWVKASGVTLYAQFGTQPKVTLPTITKPGYTCGWTTSQSGKTIEYASGEKITPNSSLSLYGVCIEKKYDLIVDPNGGIYNGQTTQYTREYTYSNTSMAYLFAHNKNLPTRTGYTFNRWYYFENTIQKPYNIYGSSNTQASSADPYFSTSLNYLMPYDNNGTEVAYDPNSTSPTSVRKNIVTVQRYKNSYYGSDSPHINPIGDYVVNINNGSTSSATPGMGGFWHKHVSKLVTENGQAAPTTGDNAGRTYVHIIVAKLSKGHYLHYNYGGTPAESKWLTSNEGTNSWKVYAYEIRYTANNQAFGHVYVSNVANNSISAGISGKYFSAQIGYSAVLDATETSPVTGYSSPHGIPQLDGTGIIKATWTANTYKVKFNANGGSGTMSDQDFTYDTAQALTANSFTKTNSKFDHWNTKADGSGTTYYNKQSVKNLTTTNGGTINLYAIWVSTLKNWSCYCSYTTKTYYCPITTTKWYEHGLNDFPDSDIINGCKIITSSGTIEGKKVYPGSTVGISALCTIDTKVRENVKSYTDCEEHLVIGQGWSTPPEGHGWMKYSNDGWWYACMCDSPNKYYTINNLTTGTVTITSSTKPTTCSYWGISGGTVSCTQQ